MSSPRSAISNPRPRGAWRLVLCVALCVVSIVAQRATAQDDLYGPPSSPSSPAANLTRDALRDITSMNPLTVMDAAANALRPGSETQSSSEGTGGTGKSTDKKGGLSTTLNILVLLTVVSLAPSIVLMTTCFVRILIVLGFLRQAMGTQSIPPPQVVTALALFMTLLVMGPTLDRIHAEAIVPYSKGEVQDYNVLWDRAKQPMRDFMFDQIEASGNWSSLYMVLDYRGVDVSKPETLTRAKVDMTALIPAYMLSELKVSFLMGFRVYLPFLVIDMVISTMLISMSMMMLPPVLISLPFKILLFVLVDGWTLVVGSLMHSFRVPEVAHAMGMLVGGSPFA